MIGKKISSEYNTYKITKKIAADNRPNANVYLCEDEQGNEFVAKHFYNGKTSPFLGYGKVNHFGRRRDGSEAIFYEIKEKSKKYDFLINHHERIKYENSWIIILEYIKGDLLTNFILKEYKTNFDLVQLVIKKLAETIKQWHSNGFAHGDPHLENAIVSVVNETPKVTLIDYSLIHHESFRYCKRIGCFGSHYNRFEEDIRNNSSMGPGFLNSLETFESSLDLGTILSDTFKESI